MKKHLLEICVATPEGLEAARRGGADRVELCNGLEVGGLTPSVGMMEKAYNGKIPFHALIRVRPGDFVYSPAEKEIMVINARIAAEMGAKALVVGGLKTDGKIDLPFMRQLVDIAHKEGVEIVYNRAFDLCAEPLQAVEQLRQLGFSGILTSGCATSAEKGVPMLREIVNRAAGRISIIAAAGITSENAQYILEATGCDDLHASAKVLAASTMTFHRPDVAMGLQDMDECAHFETSQPEVARLAQIVHK